jgi:hypothetical protein
MFVIDVFKGNPLILSFGWGAVLTNWILFVVFVGVPFLVCIASLLSGSERVLELTMVTSFLSVGMLFLVFGINIAYFRFTSCLHLIQHLSTKQSMTIKDRINATRFRLSGILHSLYIMNPAAMISRSSDCALQQMVMMLLINTQATAPGTSN